MTVYIAGCHTDYCVAVEGGGGKNEIFIRGKPAVGSTRDKTGVAKKER